MFLRNMEPMGLEGPRALCRWLLLCSLFLIAPLLQPVTGAPVTWVTLSTGITPDSPDSETKLLTHSGLRLREHARALMPGFLLVNRYVGASRA